MALTSEICVIALEKVGGSNTQGRAYLEDACVRRNSPASVHEWHNSPTDIPIKKRRGIIDCPQFCAQLGRCVNAVAVETVGALRSVCARIN
eukprot:IDg7885t1